MSCESEFPWHCSNRCFFCRIAFFAVAILAVMVQGNFIEGIEDGIESLSYEALKKLLVLDGKSESYADCVVSFLKLTGAGKDFLPSVFDVDEAVQKLRAKCNFADFICSNGGYPFLLVLILGLLALITCCCCCCCFKPCRSGKQSVIVVTRPAMYSNQENPYEPMNKVWKLAVRVNAVDFNRFQRR